MSNVISSFLVGIGFEYDRKSAQQIESGIDSIKSKALQLGSVVAGAFGLKELTFGFAQSADMLGKFGQTFGVSANDVQAFGNALATQGGSLEGFMSQLESLERARARIRVGDVGFFAPAGKAGIDPNAIANANSATEAYLGLADSFARMNVQERINAAEALGLDEASIRLLSQGRDAVEGLVNKYRSIRPLTGDMTNDAAEFNRNMVEAQANVQGLADRISGPLLKSINEVTSGINEWFGKNRQGIWADVDRLISEGEDRLKKAGGISWTDFTFWGNIGNLGGALRDSNVIQDTGNDIADWFMSPFGNKSDTNSVVPSGQFMAPNPYMQQINDQVVPSPYMQQIEEPAPAWLYRQTPASPLMPEDQPPPMSQRSSSSTQNINVSLNLDGAVIDRRVVRVVDGMAQTAIDDISSSTRG